MKQIESKNGKKMLIFDDKDNLCPYCSYPLSEDENPKFKNQCFTCNSVAKAIREAPDGSLMKNIQIHPYPFEKIICIGKYYKLKESLKESDPAHFLSLCLIHYKNDPYNLNFFSNLLKQKIKNFIDKNNLKKKDIIICGIPDLESKNHKKIDLLCNEISKKIKIPYIQVIEKIKDIPPQKKREKIQERYENVFGAYVLKEEYKEKIKKKIVFLIDDIVSTMATSYECSKILKENGAKKVYIFALGRNIFIPPEKKK